MSQTVIYYSSYPVPAILPQVYADGWFGRVRDALGWNMTNLQQGFDKAKDWQSVLGANIGRYVKELCAGATANSRRGIFIHMMRAMNVMTGTYTLFDRWETSHKALWK